MNISLSIIMIFVSLIIGYLLGSISPGIIISKVFFKIDPREHGSGNSGGTNVGRLLGKKVGLITILLDILKTLISIWSIYFSFKYLIPEGELFMDVTYYSYLSGAASMIGHTYPIFNGFKGGKSVSCFAGVLISINWGLTLVLFVLFMVILKIKKMVSLSSITCASLSFLLAAIPIFKYTMNFNFKYDFFYIVFLFITGMFVVIRHKENIKRIINKTERKIKWM